MAYPGNVYSAKCSARDALTIISGKWVMLILPVLAEGPKRNGELMRKIEGISQKVLTETLRQLERHGLVSKVDYDEKPACVEYTALLVWLSHLSAHSKLLTAGLR